MDLLLVSAAVAGWPTAPGERGEVLQPLLVSVTNPDGSGGAVCAPRLSGSRTCTGVSSSKPKSRTFTRTKNTGSTSSVWSCPPAPSASLSL